MKAIYYTESDEKIMMDKPDGTMLYQDFWKDYYFLGIRICRRKINYLCNLLNKDNKPGYK
jgi:hypothetical protein